jgi:hypothetical protein
LVTLAGRLCNCFKQYLGTHLNAYPHFFAIVGKWRFHVKQAICIDCVT